MGVDSDRSLIPVRGRYPTSRTQARRLCVVGEKVTAGEAQRSKFGEVLVGGGIEQFQSRLAKPQSNDEELSDTIGTHVFATDVSQVTQCPPSRAHNLPVERIKLAERRDVEGPVEDLHISLKWTCRGDLHKYMRDLPL